MYAASPVRGGTLHFAVEAPATIEPHELNDDPGIGIVHQACEMLVDIDVAGGCCALAWPHSGRPARGGKVWTITLRQGVTFHNGQAMTANDVVAAFKRLVNPKSGSSGSATFDFLRAWTAYAKLTSFTVAFHLKAQRWYFVRPTSTPTRP